MSEFNGEVDLGVKLTPMDVKQTAEKLRKELDSALDSTKGKELNSSLMGVENTMQSLANKSKKLSEELSALETKKIPTEQYLGLEKSIDRLEGKLNKLAITSAELQKEPDTPKNQAKLQALEMEADKLNTQLQYLIEKRDELERTGKGFILGSDTDEYRTKLAQQEELNNKMRLTLVRLQENKHYQELINDDKETESELTDEINRKQRNTSQISRAILQSHYSLRDVLQKTVSVAKSLVRVLKSKAKSPELINEKSLKKGLRLILKYVLGVRSLFLLYRKLRTAAKQSLQALAKESDIVNENMSSMMTVFSQLKNSIATIIQPILNIVAPALTHLGEVANVVTQKIANFFAVLTGQSYYYKAIKVQKNYAESLGKTAENAQKVEQALSSLDKLDVITQNKDLSTSDETAETLFEKVDVSDSANNLIEKFKEMWEKADFTSVGETIGTKLKKKLESIPWNVIQENATKTVKSISTMINGFVEVDGLGTSIGSNFAELLNTMQQSLNTFLTETHWDSIGSFIADNIMGFVTTFDGELLGKNIAEKFNAVSDLIKGFNSKMDWAKAGEFASNIVNGFFNTIKPKELGKNISDLAVGLIDGINAFLTKTNWGKVGKDIGDFVTSIDWDMIIGGLVDVFFNVIKAALKLLPALLKTLANNPDFAFDLAAVLTIKWTISIAAAALKTAIQTALNTAIGGSGVATATTLPLSVSIPYIAITAGIVYFATKAIQRGLPGQDTVEDKTKAEEDRHEAKQQQAEEEQATYNEYLNEKLKKYGSWIKLVTKGTAMEKKVLDIEKDMQAVVESSDSEELKARKLKVYEDELLNVYEYIIHDLEELDKLGKLTNAYVVTYNAKTNHVTATLRTWDDHVNLVTNTTKILNRETEKSTTTYQDFANTLKNNDSVLVNTANNAGVVASEISSIPDSKNPKVSITTMGQNLIDAAKNTLDALNVYDKTPTNPKANANVTGQDKLNTAKDTLNLLDKTNPKPKTDLLVTGQDKVDAAKKSITDLKNQDNTVTVDVQPQKQNIVQKTWNDLCTTIKKAINSGLIEPLNQLTITMNDLGGGLTSLMGNVSGGKQLGANAHNNAPQKIFTIPALKLAQGAVIPANREFLAVLGDQKQGTNVEAPLATIEQALRNVLAENGGGVSTIQVVVDGKRMAEVVWNETEKRYRQTGKR